MCLGRAQLESGDSVGAHTLLQQACELLEQSSEPGYIYNGACAYALASSIDDPAEPGSGARRAREAERAVMLFKSAVDHGMSDLDLITTDRDLEPIRNRPDFIALVRLLEAKTRKPAGPAKK